jgi:hypothetical protein
LVFSGQVLTEEETTSSLATVTKQVAISKSSNLTTGVLFGNVDPNSNNNNATGNFNVTDEQTQFWLTIDSTTNTPIDICTKDDDELSTAGDSEIPNTGYTWNSSASNTPTDPSISTSMYAITTSYDITNKIADSQTSGVYYLRFTLDIPVGQAAGSYSNTVYFKGADDATGCS